MKAVRAAFSTRYDSGLREKYEIAVNNSDNRDDCSSGKTEKRDNRNSRLERGMGERLITEKFRNEWNANER